MTDARSVVWRSRARTGIRRFMSEEGEAPTPLPLAPVSPVPPSWEALDATVGFAPKSWARSRE
eukprot:3168559-Pyramimonas_sp.AAC.1